MHNDQSGRPHGRLTVGGRMVLRTASRVGPDAALVDLVFDLLPDFTFVLNLSRPC